MGINAYKCPFCTYTTNEQTALRHHKYTHSSEKPFSCAYCSFKCVQKHDIRAHLKRSHGVELTPVKGLKHYHSDPEQVSLRDGGEGITKRVGLLWKNQHRNLGSAVVGRCCKAGERWVTVRPTYAKGSLKGGNGKITNTYLIISRFSPLYNMCSLFDLSIINP